jgi:hypothetical protein
VSVSVPGSLEFVDPPALLLFSIALVLLAFGVVSCQGSRLKNSNGILHPTGDQFFQDLEGDLREERRLVSGFGSCSSKFTNDSIHTFLPFIRGLEEVIVPLQSVKVLHEG